MAKNSYFVKDSEIIDGGESAPDFILANPESVGMTKDELIASYKNWEEEYGSEGDAIMDILHDVTAKGWIIVDQNPTGESWIIVFDTMERAKDKIIPFLMKMTEEKKVMNFNDGLRAF
jgi:hypothetical protein